MEKVLDRPLVEEDVMRLLNFLNQQERNGKYFRFLCLQEKDGEGV